MEETNNTEHVAFHCPLAKFIWDIVKDIILITLGIKIYIDVKAALIKFWKINKENNNKRNRKFCNTLIVIARKVIYTTCQHYQLLKK